MPLNALAIADSATTLSVTGGTSKTFTPDGQTVFNGIHVADNSVTDFRLKPHITFKNRNPQRKADGTYGKGKREFILTEPYLDASTGKVEFATYRYSCEFAAVIPAANLKNGRYKAAQLCFDTDAENFHAAGDIS